MTSITRRIEQLADKLQARTNHEGKPLPGYTQNVASIKAEMAQLQERLGNRNDGE